MTMKDYKILMIYTVRAEDRQEARKIFANAQEAHHEDSFFDVQIIKEKDDPYKGVLGTIKKYTGY
jgi:hypothetical protein